MTAPQASALYVGHVMHQRLRPRRHRLGYRVYQMLVDIDELPSLHARLRCFALDRFSVFSLHACDYGDGSGAGLRAQAEARLRAAGLPTSGRIELLTMPRVLGHGFNPLSVWFCHALGGGGLRALIFEVNNTFGQRHSYLMPVQDTGAPVIDLACDKQFYVSPFNGMAQHYRFRVTRQGETMSVGVSVHDDSGALVLNTRIDGQRRALGDAALLRVFLTHPLLTLKVVAAIRWEALRLWLKRVPLQKRPAASAHDLTIASTSDPT